MIPAYGRMALAEMQKAERQMADLQKKFDNLLSEMIVG